MLIMSFDGGIKDDGRARVFKVHGPGFHSSEADLGDIMTIGSGTDSDAFLEELRYLNAADGRRVYEHFAEVPFGQATVFGLTLSEVIRQHPMDGVAPFLHFVTVGSEGVTIWPGNRRYPAGGGEDHVMPAVAKSWAEFSERVSVHGAAKAIA